MITNNTRFATCLISFGLLSVAAYCVDRVTYVNADLEDGATATLETMHTGERWWFIHDDDKALYNPRSGSAEPPWISASIAYKGSHSLQMTLDPRTDVYTPDRSELNVYHQGYSDPPPAGYGIPPFKFYNPIYFGFAMYVHPSSGVLDADVVFTQVWQSNTGSQCSVPVIGVLDQGSGGENPWTYHFNRHDDDVTTNGTHPVIPKRVLTAGWHTFMFYLEPNPNSNPNLGRLSIFIDKDPKRVKADYDSLVDMGCNLKNEPGNVILDEWNIRAGLYRPNCPPGSTTCKIIPNNNSLYVFYDNIRIGNDWDHVNPDSINVGPKAP